MSVRITQIRKKAIELLKGISKAEDRVFSNVVTPVWEEKELPAICVYTRSEEVTELQQAPKAVKRVLTLSIEIKARGPELGDELKDGKIPIDDCLEQIVHEVECQILANEGFDCLVGRTDLVGVEYEYEGSGAIPIGAARITFNLVYDEDLPPDQSKQSGIDDLNKIQAGFKLKDNSP